MKNTSSDPSARLYLVLHPNDALIASQLSPEDFAAHYQLRSGAGRHGKLIFAEVDPSCLDSHFDVKETLSHLHAHPDGTPKRTKFLSCYRTLERVDLNAIRNLYLSNPDGSIMGLPRADRPISAGGDELKIFSEICPVSMMVLTRMPLSEFAKVVSDPSFGKGAPRMFVTALDIDVAALINAFERNPFAWGPIASLHPSRLRDAVAEVTDAAKPMKGLCLSSGIDDVSFKYVRGGFWFVERDSVLAFEMPDIHDIERDHYRFWRAL